jgi:hypothetical protein
MKNQDLAREAAIVCAKAIGLYDPHTHPAETEMAVQSFDSIIRPFTEATFYGKLSGKLSNEVRAGLMREEVLKRQVVAVQQVLRLHHQHAQEMGSVYFEQDGKPIEMSTDLGEAYIESDLYGRTEKVLNLEAIATIEAADAGSEVGGNGSFGQAGSGRARDFEKNS